MNRRNFMATILATGMFPAIVRAESLMRIVVPRRDIILPWSSDWLGAGGGGHSDYDDSAFNIYRLSVVHSPVFRSQREVR